MIDVNKVLDPVKLKLYHEWLYNSHKTDDGNNQLQQDLTRTIAATYIDNLNLSKTAKILDVACGPGYFLDEMKLRGYTDIQGVTLSDDDISICNEKEHVVHKLDMSFLPNKVGFKDESIDFIFARQALEHSPYPIFTLAEWNRILKQSSKIYIEVPAPNCVRNHEMTPNHYSVLGEKQLCALLVRAGFNIEKFDNFEFDIKVQETGKKKPKTVHEKYYSIIAVKQRSLDIK